MLECLEVPGFLVETKKLIEANMAICLGCETIFGNSLLIDPYWSLAVAIRMHRKGAGVLDNECKKFLYLKVDWNLVKGDA